MGFGLVILIHLVAIFFLSLFVSFISIIVTYFISRKPKKNRKLLMAAVFPFLGFYSTYFLALIGSIFVSEVKDVDLGIGDAWYVPIHKNCQLLMIDLPDQAYINCDEEDLISNVKTIFHRNEYVYGKTDEYFFSANMENGEIIKYGSQSEFSSNCGIAIGKLKSVEEYYNDRKWNIAGTWLSIVGILSLLISSIILIGLGKIILVINLKKKTSANNA